MVSLTSSFFMLLPRRLSQLQGTIHEHCQTHSDLLQVGHTGQASAPSNIALLKYWGKQEQLLQVPMNSSISLTLGGLRTHSQVTINGWNPAGALSDDLNLRFGLQIEGIVGGDQRIELFLSRILHRWGEHLGFDLVSHANFPACCGIASSASGFAALVGAIADLLHLDQFLSPSDLEYWLAEWARVGSGSATRSTIRNPDLHCVAWELLAPPAEADTTDIPGTETTNVGATTRTRQLDLDASLRSDLRHCVLLLDTSPKGISSTQGHGLAPSPLQTLRLAGLPRRFSRLCEALEKGNFDDIAALAEDDAFRTHAVMATTLPEGGYLRSDTAAVLALFETMRKDYLAKAFWTLDAGPNPHFIYLRRARAFMHEFFETLPGVLGIAPRIVANDVWQGLVLGPRAGLLTAPLRSSTSHSTSPVRKRSAVKVNDRDTWDSTPIEVPAKVILLGEHAVLYGYPALAVALSDRFLRISTSTPLTDPLAARFKVTQLGRPVETSGPHRMLLKQALDLAWDLARAEVRSAALLPVLPPFARQADPASGEIHLDLDFQLGAGLGASAALSLALIQLADRCFANARRSIPNLIRSANQIDDLFHGKASGLDVTTCAMRRIVRFALEEKPARVRSPKEFLLFALHTSEQAPTRKMVEYVAQRAQQRPRHMTSILERIGHEVNLATSSLEIGDLFALGAAMNRCQDLLVELGVSTARIDRTVALLRECGALGAKLTGAGGGGMVIGLFEHAKDDTRIRERLRSEKLPTDFWWAKVEPS